MIVAHSEMSTSPPWWKAAWDAVLVYFVATAMYLMLGNIAPFGAVIIFGWAGLDQYEVYYGTHALHLLFFETTLVVVMLTYPIWPKSDKEELLSWSGINRRWLAIGLAFGVIVIMLAVDFLYQYFANTQPTEFVAYLMYAMTTASAPVVLLAGGMIGPFFEELMFRGFLQSSFQKTVLGFWGSAVLISTAWSLIHFYDWGQTLILVVHGVLLAGLRRLSGSVVPSIISHSAFNIILFIYFMNWVK